MSEKFKLTPKEINAILDEAVKRQIRELWEQRDNTIPPPHVTGTGTPGEYALDFDAPESGAARAVLASHKKDLGEKLGKAHQGYLRRNKKLKFHGDLRSRHFAAAGVVGRYTLDLSLLYDSSNKNLYSATLWDDNGRATPVIAEDAPVPFEDAVKACQKNYNKLFNAYVRD